ncbi:uncharacterized protein [Euphorbia lathyris]|uniref:uncharacterized protein isoform X2 n=1 Tax=Euphorbia lathyris TaxID=212925 RepID=UPI003314007A
MSRGLVFSSQTRATITRLPLSLPKWRCPIFTSFPLHTPLCRTPIRLFCCKSSPVQLQIELANYNEAFSRRMAMAGLKPHHRIAIGVSGGPDSMALCFLTAAWKTEGCIAVGKSEGFVDGLLAIVVDHGLRSESKEEAYTVSHRVSEMGIRCEIASCSWPHGRPKQGHLQEEARDIRYQKLQNVCIQHQTGVLLIAHHADDQAELFILRLSRNSGVLGLAGMAFVSQMLFSSSHMYDEDSKNEGILVVRPLLDFSKEDMYKVCQAGGHDWVEDPTNQSPVYARNRIRMSLKELSSSAFKYELQAVISACQKTRAFVDQMCSNLVNQAVTLNHHGYAIIDLEILNPSKIMDVCLAKFVTLILQFVSQRHRPVRGTTSKLLLDYLRRFPCKTSLTAAGCYLCPAPGSRGTKVVVCCSVDCPMPSKMELTCIDSDQEQRQYVPCELEKIIADAKSCSDHFSPDPSEVYFLESTSESVLTEAKRLNIISESTYRNVLSLQKEELEHFKAKLKDGVDCESKNEVQSIIASLRQTIRPGQTCFFINRFLVKWEYDTTDLEKTYYEGDSRRANSDHCSLFCKFDRDMGAEVRPMIESDWLYLAKLSKCPSLNDLDEEIIYEMEPKTEKKNLYFDYLRFSAERSLTTLKSIPVAARRSLPVLVDHRGRLLSIPSIGFNICHCLKVSCVFKPRVPLGGGYSSFM